MYTLLKNGLIVDGTGALPYRADIVIRDDKIVLVGSAPKEISAEIADLSGSIVCPGFIDVHSHSDISLLHHNNPCSKVMQGITTEVTGNCGFSPFPLCDGADFIRRRRASLAVIDVDGVEWSWRDLDGYRQKVQQAKPITNLLPLVGYGSIRAMVMDYRSSPPTNKEMENICALLSESLAQGAAGLSVGLGYPPDFYADSRELIAIAKAVRAADKIFTLHMRGERTDVFAAVEEAMGIALLSGVRMEMSHLKCAGRGSAGRSGELLQRIEQGCSRGADITFDIYPYCCGSTCLAAAFPPWAQEGGMDALLQRLSDESLLPDILRDVGGSYEDFGDSLTVSFAANTPYAIGRTMEQLGTLWGCTAERAAVNIMQREQGRVEIISRLTRWEDLDNIALHPLCLYGTDGLAMNAGADAIRTMPHPRYFGTVPALFERYLHSGLLSLHELVHRLTLKPAQRFGIAKRGAVREGWYADLLALPPEGLSCSADFINPLVPAKGVRHMWVNGQRAVWEGVILDCTAGRVV